MSNFKITRIVLAMSALVGFTGVQAMSQQDLQNSSVYKKYSQNQGVDQEHLTAMNEWKVATKADPTINLDDYDLSWFTPDEKNELYNYQADIQATQNYGNLNTGVDAYSTTATANSDSDVDNSAVVQQWKEYIAKEIEGDYPLDLSTTAGFDHFSKEDQETLLGYALKQTLAKHSDNGFSDSEEEPWEDEQPSSNSTVSGVKKAGSHINNAGQWVANTSVGQGAVEAANEIGAEIKTEMKEMAAQGTKTIFRGALNKLLRKMGLDPVAQPPVQPVQPNVVTTPAQSNSQTQPVQYGPQPKYQENNPATLYQPQSQPGYQPARRSGPPAPPRTPGKYNNSTTPVVSNSVFSQSTSTTNNTGSTLNTPAPAFSSETATPGTLPKILVENSPEFNDLPGGEQKTMNIYRSMVKGLNKNHNLQLDKQPGWHRLGRQPVYNQTSLVSYQNRLKQGN